MSGKLKMFIIISFPSTVLQDENFCAYFQLYGLFAYVSISHKVLLWYDTQVLHFQKIDKWPFGSGGKGKEYPIE